MADVINKKVGRPKLSPEERELRRIAKYKRDNERKKAQGWVAQKKYQATRRSQIYEARLCIPLDKKETLKTLLAETNLSATQLFVGAVEEKYGVILSDKEK